jgi:hypothetical protein
MADKNIKKTKVATHDVGGLKSTRYEKIQVSYGTIATTDWTWGTTGAGDDVLIFSEVPSQDIIRATIVLHRTSPVVLDIYPGTNTAAVIDWVVGGTAADRPQISYVINYVRGTGSVGTSGPGDLLRVRPKVS